MSTKSKKLLEEVDGALAITGNLSLSGGLFASTDEITNGDSPYAVATGDYTILCDCSGGAIEVDFPAAADNTGRILTIKKIDSSVNAVTVDGNAAETIDGATTLVFSNQWDAYKLQCDGTAWYII